MNKLHGLHILFLVLILGYLPACARPQLGHDPSLTPSNPAGDTEPTEALTDGDAQKASNSTPVPEELLPRPSEESPLMEQPPQGFSQKPKACTTGYKAVQDACTRCTCVEGQWFCKSICPPTMPAPANREPRSRDHHWTTE